MCACWQPIGPRNNVMCVSKNYANTRASSAGSGFDASAKQAVPDAPVIFTKALSAIVGPGEDVGSATMAPPQVITRENSESSSVLAGASTGTRSSTT